MARQVHRQSRRQVYVSVETVIEHVAFELDCDAAELLTFGKRRRALWRKAAVVWVAAKLGQSLPRIAAAIGHAYRHVYDVFREGEMLRLFDADFRALTDQLAAMIPAALLNDR